MSQTQSSMKNSRKRASPDDHIESLSVHGDPATSNPNDCLPTSMATKDLEVVAKPAGSSSWLTETGEVPAKPAGSSSWLTEIQEMVEGACNLEYDHLKEANSTQSQIDLSVRHLRDYIIAIGPEFYSPGEVQESYECLQKAIHDFAAGFFPTVTWAQLSPDEQSKVKAWAPRAEQFMESQRGRQALFQAWLWHILDDNIFSANPSTKWQGVKDTMMPWHLVGQLMDIFQTDSDTRPFRKRAVKYYIWRALSADLAYDVSKSPSTMPRGYAAQLVRNELGHLIENTGVNLKVVLKAVNDWAEMFDLDIMKGRFKTSLKWDTGLQPSGFPYSTGFNEYDLGQPKMILEDLFLCCDKSKLKPVFEGQPVELVIAPALGVHGHGSQVWKTYMAGHPGVFTWVKEMTVVVGQLPGPGEDDDFKTSSTVVEVGGV